MLPVGPHSKFTGRAEELRQVRRVMNETMDGQSRTVIIGGEAGVGKSRLLGEVITQCVPSNAIVLIGNCIDYDEAPLAFGAILDALRPLDSILDTQTRSKLFGDDRSGGSGGSLGADSSPAFDSRPQLFEAVLSMLEDIAKDKPVVLAIEDLQWADRSTRDLLTFLVMNLASTRVALFVTYRSDELREGDELLRYFVQLSRSRSVTRLHLSRFGYEDLASHLDDIAESAVDDYLFAEIWQLSQGNPFFAEELLAAREQGRADKLSTTLRDMLLGRFKALDSATQEVLRIASVGGTSIDARALEFVLGGEKSDMFSAALRDALERQILFASGAGDRLTFRHALLREIAYSELLANERRITHLSYARWLISVDGTISGTTASNGRSVELAFHYFHGGDETAALGNSIECAAAAEASRGYAESHAHLERALDLWEKVDASQRPSGADRIGLLKKTARVSGLEGNNARAVQLTRIALSEAGDKDDRHFSLLLSLGCYLEALGESREALQVFEEVVHQVDGSSMSDLESEALCAYARSLLSRAQHRESVQYAQRALTIAQEMKNLERESNALSILGCNRVALGEPDVGVDNLRRALELADRVGLPQEIASGYRLLASTFSGPLNRLEEALDVAVEGVERVEQLGLERYWGVALRSIVADTLFRMGRWDEADDVVAIALRRAPQGAPQLDLLLARAKLTVGRGQFDLAKTDLDAVRSLSARTIELRYKVPLETLTAGLALWQGNVDAARTAVQSGMDCVSMTDDVWFAGPLIWHALRAESERADIARANFDVKESTAAIERSEELREMSRASCRQGKAMGALSLVVDAYDGLCEGELRRTKGEAAVSIWRHVLECWDALQQPYPAAYARLRLGEALLLDEPNSAKRAAPVLREAHNWAIDVRAKPLSESIERVAKAAAIDLEVVDLTTGIELIELSVAEQIGVESGLTKRETQILELIAAGESNRSIADACYISEKTASVHVSRIMNKLGVRSRSQVAALLHRRSV